MPTVPTEQFNPDIHTAVTRSNYLFDHPKRGASSFVGSQQYEQYLQYAAQQKVALGHEGRLSTQEKAAIKVAARQERYEVATAQNMAVEVLKVVAENVRTIDQRSSAWPLWQGEKFGSQATRDVSQVNRDKLAQVLLQANIDEIPPNWDTTSLHELCKVHPVFIYLAPDASLSDPQFWMTMIEQTPAVVEYAPLLMLTTPSIHAELLRIAQESDMGHSFVFSDHEKAALERLSNEEIGFLVELHPLNLLIRPQLAKNKSFVDAHPGILSTNYSYFFLGPNIVVAHLWELYPNQTTQLAIANRLSLDAIDDLDLQCRTARHVLSFPMLCQLLARAPEYSDYDFSGRQLIEVFLTRYSSEPQDQVAMYQYCRSLPIEMLQLIFYQCLRQSGLAASTYEAYKGLFRAFLEQQTSPATIDSIFNWRAAVPSINLYALLDRLFNDGLLLEIDCSRWQPQYGRLQAAARIRKLEHQLGITP